MMREGPRIAPGKVRKKRLYYLLPVRLVVLFLFYFILIVIFFCDLNV